MAAERLIGVETEYAVAAFRGRGVRAPQSELLDGLMTRARSRLPHLLDEHSHGMFLGTGARFYVDAGGHPELTTPECGTPDEVVRFIRTGEQMLLELTREPLAAGAAAVYRSNVDYSGSGSTWGCHESYLHRADPTDLPAQMIPHFVSRVVFTGAGGFDNTSAGVKFTLSPRATHVHNTVSGESTSRRGIYHAKDESLADRKYHRLHVTFGESLCSDLAIWLKVGTTALVLALCEAGLRPGEGMALDAPVAAAKLISADPTCSTLVATTRGKRTAVGIQRHYLEQVEAQLGAALLPPWAADVCRRWRWMLDRLEEGPDAVATTLDWAIKWALLRDHAERRGIAWTSLPAWTTLAERVASTVGRATFRRRLQRTRLLGGLAFPVPEALSQLQSEARGLGLEWNDLERFLDVRDQLFELDTRFGQLGDRGIFASLDRACVLTHRIEGSDAPADALPTIPRARIRAQLVRELSGNADRYRCDWSHVWDCAGNKCVDLRDPFTAVSEWKDGSEAGRGSDAEALGLETHIMLMARRRRLSTGEPVSPLETTDPIVLSERARRHRLAGQLAEAEQIFRRAIAIEDGRVAADSPKRPHRRNHLAMVLLRAGRYIEAGRWNAHAWILKARQHDLVSGRILFIRTALRLLQGDRDVRFYLGQLKSVFLLEPLVCLADVATNWDIPDVLQTLAERLAPEPAMFMTHLSDALNDTTTLPVLDTYEQWRTAEAVGLEAPWPVR